MCNSMEKFWLLWGSVMENTVCQRGPNLISDGKCRWLIAWHSTAPSFLNFLVKLQTISWKCFLGAGTRKSHWVEKQVTLHPSYFWMLWDSEERHRPCMRGWWLQQARERDKEKTAIHNVVRYRKQLCASNLSHFEFSCHIPQEICQGGEERLCAHS